MKRSDIPTLDDLRAFEAVARLGSIRAAATELSLTHGAISRRVSKLSNDIAIKLLTPQGRGITLTPDGEKLHIALTQSFEILTRTLSEIRDTSKSEPLLLSCERSVAMRWLIPRLSNFQDQYPDIIVNLSVGGGSLDFEKEKITMAVRRLDFLIDPNWKVEHLFKERMGPVMKPSAQKSFMNGDYIALGTRTRPKAWQEWLVDNPEAPAPKEVRLLDHHFLMVEAAVNDLGIAMCPEVIATDNVKHNILVAPLGFVDNGSEYGLISHNSMEPTPASEALRRWIHKEGRALRDVNDRPEKTK